MQKRLGLSVSATAETPKSPRDAGGHWRPHRVDEAPFFPTGDRPQAAAQLIHRVKALWPQCPIQRSCLDRAFAQTTPTPLPRGRPARIKKALGALNIRIPQTTQACADPAKRRAARYRLLAQPPTRHAELAAAQGSEQEGEQRRSGRHLFDLQRTGSHALEQFLEIARGL